MTCQTDKNTIVNPYVFQPAALHWMDMTDHGLYRTNTQLQIALGEKPRIQDGQPNAGCCGDGWTLDADGNLLVLKGLEWNGPTFLDDAACRMLASLVHDILCSDEAMAGGGCYTYFRRHAFYGDICKAQGEAAWFAWTSTQGLRAFNWMNVIIEHLKERKRLRRKASQGTK